jgi:cation transport ATPase
MTTIRYEVSGLTCEGCVKRVKSLLENHAESVEVTLSPPQAILHEPKTTIGSLNNALSQLGNYQLHSYKAEKKNQAKPEAKSWLMTYKPLLLVVAYIITVTLTIEISFGHFVLNRWMQNFMAGFFIVFSFFKLLDIAGFASSYAMYDLLAKRCKSYAYAYPFIELGLGFAYILQLHMTLVYCATLIVIGFSTIGVILTVSKKQTIRCACLGTGFNLPMSTLTIIEDLAMVAMAASMLMI